MVIKIFELAQRRKDVSDWIEDRTLPVIDALAQLYLFPNTEYVNHWKREVWGNLSRVKLLSGKKKLPSKKFILDSSWEIHKNRLDDCLEYAIGKEYLLTPRSDTSSSEFYQIVEKYFDWLAGELSARLQVFPKDVYSKLEELGL